MRRDDPPSLAALPFVVPARRLRRKTTLEEIAADVAYSGGISASDMPAKKLCTALVSHQEPSASHGPAGTDSNGGGPSAHVSAERVQSVGMGNSVVLGAAVAALSLAA